MSRKNTELRKLEELLVVLPTPEHALSKVSIVGELYLGVYKAWIKKNLPNYREYKIIFN